MLPATNDRWTFDYTSLLYSELLLLAIFEMDTGERLQQFDYWRTLSAAY